MKKKIGSKSKSSFAYLLILYFCCVIIRYVLAVLSRNYPNVKIDEFLYYSLGRSIATEGKLLYHGQPALYNYYLYPLFLAPIYLLFPSGVNFFRIIQLWNTMLMSVSVFPIYGLCKAAYADERKAFGIAAACMLLPDFYLNQFIFSEALIYPLFFSLLYCTYRLLMRHELRYAAWIGGLGALLYFTKPGTVALPAVILLMMLIFSIREKAKNALLIPAVELGSFAIVFLFLWFILKTAFAYEGPLLSIYDEQIDESQSASLYMIFQTVLLYPYYFLLGCGIIPVVVSISRYKAWNTQQRFFFQIMTVSLIVTMIGTALVINGSEGIKTVYLRYVDMYIPVFLITALLPANETAVFSEEKRKKDRTLLLVLLILAYLVVCTAVWGCRIGVSAQDKTYGQMPISVLSADRIQGTGNILIIAMSGFLLYLFSREQESKKAAILCMGFFISVCIVNNIAGYRFTAGRTSPTLAASTKAAQADLKDEEYLFIYSDQRSTVDHGLDVNSRKNIHQIMINDFYNHVWEDGGLYVPFVPKPTRGMKSAYLLPDVSTIVMDYSVYPMMQFNDNVSVTYSPKQELCIARFKKGTRIIDSIMGNVFDRNVHANAPAVLALCKEEWITNPLKIRLEIESSLEQTMYYFSDNEQSSVTLQPGRQWYEMKMTKPADVFNFLVQKRGIKIYQYEVALEEKN